MQATAESGVPPTAGSGSLTFLLECMVWRGDRVVEGAALEKRYGATHRGFESHSLRHPPSRSAGSLWRMFEFVG